MKRVTGRPSVCRITQQYVNISPHLCLYKSWLICPLPLPTMVEANVIVGLLTPSSFPRLTLRSASTFRVVWDWYWCPSGTLSHRCSLRSTELCNGWLCRWVAHLEEEQRKKERKKERRVNALTLTFYACALYFVPLDFV